MKKKLDLIVDSGAFSSWCLGQTIDVAQYADYLLENEEWWGISVNLDVIPGKFGQKPSAQEVEHSAAQSWQNLKYLESRGLSPMPVFHQGERFYWLEKMISEGYDYIGISPDNGKHVNEKKQWLDDVFSTITDDDGCPIVNTHGFAVTSIDLMCRYPWKSVDSATWFRSAGFGIVFVPKTENGEFVFNKSPVGVVISDKAKNSMMAGTHFKSFGKDTQKRIIKFFESEGYNYDGMAHSFEARVVLCIRLFNRAASSLKNPKFVDKTYGLFTKHPNLSHLKSSIKIPDVNLFFAVSCASIYSDILTVENLNKRLFTYEILRKQKSGFLEFYTKTGCYPMGRCTKRWCNPGEIGAIKDTIELLPRTDRGTLARKNEPIRKLRNWNLNKER